MAIAIARAASNRAHVNVSVMFIKVVKVRALEPVCSHHAQENCKVTPLEAAPESMHPRRQTRASLQECPRAREGGGCASTLSW